MPDEQMMISGEQIQRPIQIAQRAVAAADRYTVDHVFTEYHQRIDADTLRRQQGDLRCFSRFLADIKAIDPQTSASFAQQLFTEASAWEHVSFGLITAFMHWQVQHGYAIGSMNVRLASIKRYCSLAHIAGQISSETLALIRNVRGYSGRHAQRIDDERRDQGKQQRNGAKKAQARSIDNDQLRQLKQQPNTPQGLRDRLIVCLLADHGLRVGEAISLHVESIDLEAGLLHFFREKVQKQQTHRLSAATLMAAHCYLTQNQLTSGQLLRGSRKNGALWGNLSARSLRQRIRLLGQQCGIEDLSPHDLRHNWASRAVRGGSDPFALRDAGGWSSLAMPNRYVAAATIANERISLEE